MIPTFLRILSAYRPAWQRALGLCALVALGACAAPHGPHATRHMIVAANPHAAEAGLAMLRDGGSAVDAAIAAQMILTLVEPQSSGIGGGGFLIHFSPGNAEMARPPAIVAFDGRETAPRAVDGDLFLSPDGLPISFPARAAGGLPVGVPGVLRMFAEAHARYGRLPWRRLFEPAIRLAEQGFPVSPRLHALIADDAHLKSFPAARGYFFTPDGAPLPVGHLLRNPPLAETLRQLAEGGADAFYGGAIANDIIAAVRNSPVNPGRMTSGDLTAYRAPVRTALCVPYRLWQVCGMPPPSSGAIAIGQILAFLEPFDMRRIEPNSAQAAHLIAEASRLAFADRSQYLGDPAFVRVPVAGLLDRAYLRARGQGISTLRSMGSALPGIPPDAAPAFHAADDEPQKADSTTHLSVVDSFGNAVSLTSSIGLPFGSRLLVRGFMLNDQLTDFSAIPVRDGRPVANAAAGSKRPLSSMSPTIVTTERDGRLVMVAGSPGGLNIIGYVARTLIATLDWRMTMQEAVAAPNFLNRNGPTLLERGTAVEALAAPLTALGHRTEVRPLVSGLHGIRVVPGGLEGGADPRREGVVMGD